MNEFDRLAPACVAFFCGSLAMSFWFASVVITGGTPVQANTYGEAVYTIPAIVWAGVQAFFSIMAVYGFARRDRRLAMVGAGGLGVLFAFFGIAAMEAAQGTLLQAGSLMWASPVSFLAALICGGKSDR